MDERKLPKADILSQAREQKGTKTPQQTEPPVEVPLPAFTLAASNGDLSAVVSMLATGADINESVGNGMTPLCYALRREQLEVAHHLVDSGADVECVGAEIPPLFDAIACGDVSLVRKMLDRGADIRRQAPDDGSSALMRASTEEMIAFLVSQGASFDARNDAGLDVVENCRYQAEAIRRHEEARAKHYARLGEACSTDSALKEKLLAGLEEYSEEDEAREYDALAEILVRYRDQVDGNRNPEQ